METTSSLQTADYVVVSCLLLISLGIGVLFAMKDFRNASRVEYLLGGRRMMMLPVSLSVFATMASGISVLGCPTECYLYGAISNLNAVGIAIANVLAAYTLVPLLHPLRLTSLYEYHQLRFNSEAVRMFVLIIGMLQTLFYMSIALLAPALALQTGTDMPLWMSVGVIGVIASGYTAIGGIKSVIWTDVLQSVVMLIGILTVIIKGTLLVGGPGTVFQTALAGGRLSFNDFSPDPRARNTWWATIIGGCFFCLSNICSQSSLQRISSMKSMKSGQRAFSLNGIFQVAYGVLLVTTGCVMYTYNTVIRCDPVKAGLITNANQLPPYFVSKAMRDLPGVNGVYMASIFSASLSTVSSGINALATNTVEDLLRRPLRNVQESTIVLITKLIVLLYGTLIMGFAYGASFLQGSINQIVISISGAWGGPMFGILVLGALFPWANKYGAIGGGVLALVFNMWLVLGNFFYGQKYKVLALPPTDMCFTNDTFSNYTSHSVSYTVKDPSDTAYNISSAKGDSKSGNFGGFFFYDISFHWYSFYGALVSLVMGSIISYFTQIYSEPQTDLKTLFPFVRNWWLSRSQTIQHDDCKNEEDKMIKLKKTEVKL